MKFSVRSYEDKLTYLTNLFAKVKDTNTTYLKLYTVLTRTPAPTEERLDSIYQKITDLSAQKSADAQRKQQNILTTIHQQEKREKGEDQQDLEELEHLLDQQ